MDRCISTVIVLSRIIFAYNFYVYLITGKLFRSDLHKLLCRCFSSSSSAPAPAHAHAHALGALAPVAVAAAAAAAADDDDDDDDAQVARRAVADTAV